MCMSKCAIIKDNILPTMGFFLARTLPYCIPPIKSEENGEGKTTKILCST